MVYSVQNQGWYVDLLSALLLRHSGEYPCATKLRLIDSALSHNEVTQTLASYEFSTGEQASSAYVT